MVYDIEMLRSFYSNFPKRVDVAREKIGRPMTLAEKILYAHLYDEEASREIYDNIKEIYILEINKLIQKLDTI